MEREKKEQLITENPGRNKSILLAETQAMKEEAIPSDCRGQVSPAKPREGGLGEARWEMWG